jgi:formylglycine-generating enzyme required for sulfatase activity
MKMRLLGLGAVLMAQVALANNVVVTNVDTKWTADTTKIAVRFDLSWDNSWRDATNYDACWIFLKYNLQGTNTWKHCTLGGSGVNPPGFSAGSDTNLQIVVPSDRKGAFIQLAATGGGSIVSTNVQFIWEFTTDGVPSDANVKINVFAIEMVYVSQGSFDVGSGGYEFHHLYKYVNGTTSNQAYTVSSEAAITCGTTAGNLWADNMLVGTVPAAFPKGYNAFYATKYEVSQRQYCDFLNTLTEAQQNSRTNAYVLYGSMPRQFIKKTGTSPAFYGCDADNDAGLTTNATASLLNESNDGEWVASVGITWQSALAYWDWAALRPMTELEWEKASRGPMAPVPYEYAWGSDTGVVGGSYANLSTISETITAGNANLREYVATGGSAIRCGAYGKATSTRVGAGVSFYGIQDMSGNVADWLIGTSTAAHRGFAGGHGDGTLTAAGASNVADWPTGFGQLRNYDMNANYYRTSARPFANDSYSGPFYYCGAGPGVRAAP